MPLLEAAGRFAEQAALPEKPQYRDLGVLEIPGHE